MDYRCLAVFMMHFVTKAMPINSIDGKCRIKKLGQIYCTFPMGKPLIVNDRPISDPYSKLCTHTSRFQETSRASGLTTTLSHSIPQVTYAYICTYIHTFI